MISRDTLFATAFAFVLSACGGGSSDSPAPIGNTDSPPQSDQPDSANKAPIADAGPDQTVGVGQTVTLDGSGSYDPDDRQLILLTWSLKESPKESVVKLSATTGRNPVFVPDVDGSYTFELVVDDGVAHSAPDTVVVTASAGIHFANAGPDLFVETGKAITLDGTASHTPTGSSLDYKWSFTGIPIGSTAELQESNSVTPFFIPDKDGQYFINLMVTDGAGASDVDRTVVTATSPSDTNQIPIADPGSDQKVATGSVVSLDGTKSSDPENSPLEFAWELISMPTGSNAALSSVNASKPTFTVDLDGLYVVSLIVNDGTNDSQESRVAIVADTPNTNSSPVADTGPDTIVFLGQLAFLDGTPSTDPDGDPLTYTWTPVSVPANTNATLFDETSSVAYFAPDVPGIYSFELTVSDGNLESKATVSIGAITPPPPPVTDANVHVLSTDLFGDPIYLGCWTCSRFDSDSIHNDFGRYGSQFSSTSIRNRFSRYGDRYGSQSACNKFGYNAPYMFRGDGTYFGRLSVNEFLSGGICSIGNYKANDCLLLRTYCGS